MHVCVCATMCAWNSIIDNDQLINVQGAHTHKHTQTQYAKELSRRPPPAFLLPESRLSNSRRVVRRYVHLSMGAFCSHIHVTHVSACYFCCWRLGSNDRPSLTDCRRTDGPSPCVHRSPAAASAQLTAGSTHQTATCFYFSTSCYGNFLLIKLITEDGNLVAFQEL